MLTAFSIDRLRAKSLIAAIRSQRALLPVLTIALVAVLACGPMTLHGASAGHSAVSNTLWLQHFSEQLRQGDLYPRWLMNINRGEGSPAFYYYAPLPFYIISIPGLLAPTASLSAQMAWGEILLLALSGLTFFLYARKRFGIAAALSASIVYMLLPYHFETDLWVRQDLGELASYIWMPLILLYTDALLAGSRSAVASLAIVYGLLILSHLPSALLFSVCLLGYALVQIPHKTWLKDAARFTWALSLGILLSGAYLVPALFSQHEVHMEAIWIPRNDFHGWFFPPTDWAKANRHYPFMSRLFIEASLTVFLFAVTWLAALYRAPSRSMQAFKGSLLLLGIAAFLMTSASAIVWEHVPLLWKVQFPWRLSVVLDIAAAIGALYAMDRMFSGRNLGATLAIAVVTSVLVWCIAAASLGDTLWPHLQPEVAQRLGSQIEGDLELPEYATRWTSGDLETIVAHTRANDLLRSDSDSAKLILTRWRPRHIEFDVQLDRPTRVAVHQFYFPNWRARDDADHSLAVSADPTSGLLSVQLPPGRYHVNLALVALQTEALGWLVSGLGAGVLIFLRLSRPSGIDSSTRPKDGPGA